MMPDTTDPTWERATLLALKAEWVAINHTLFEGALRSPMIDWSDGMTLLGAWITGQRRLTLSRTFVASSPWGRVVEVLKHETAHQYVDEALHIVDESAHGATFRRVCEERGIDARAAGMPEVAVDDESASVRRRIEKLLALAGSPNPHEAAAAASMARKLRLKHRLDVGTSDSADYGWKQLGPVLGRVTEVDRWLAHILEAHAFVEVVFVTSYDTARSERGRILEVCGTAADLEFAEWMYVFLRRTAERLADDHVRRQGGGKRAAFMAGVLSGVHETLGRSAAESAAGDAALVWRGDPALHAYFRKRHPRLRTTRGRVRRGRADHHAGQAEGRRVVVHRPISGRGGFGGLLGP
ncbi:MAG: hypothetical protein RIS21_893 [Planctomycetota bacterium]|jgi:hypothetical protein